MIRIYWLWLFGWRTIAITSGTTSDMWGARKAPYVDLHVVKHPSYAALRRYTWNYTHRQYGEED